MPQLNQFVQSMHGGGARANQFAVAITGGGNNTAGLGSRDFAFLCRSAQIPALTMGEVSVPYRGRQIFLPGDRTYDAWTITVFNDGNMSIRDDVERWQNDIQDIGNETKTALTSPYRTATVLQMSKNSKSNAQFIRKYTLHGIWPTTVDAIDLAYDTNDVIEEFGITFRFNYMVATPGQPVEGTKTLSGSTQVGTGNAASSDSAVSDIASNLIGKLFGNFLSGFGAQ